MAAPLPPATFLVVRFSFAKGSRPVMLLPSEIRPGPFLAVTEFGLTVTAVLAAFTRPQLGAEYFERMERGFERLSRRKGLIVYVGLSVIVLRVALLPLFPVPLPFVTDDFSFLFACDTFAHGRLANPTPAMWPHFETILITMRPTYQSMYFPGQGLLLAAGQVLVGQPWFALLAMDGLMCAALTWALQGWLPRRWALLGGIIAVLRLGLFSVWINTYQGAALLAAFGGALVLGGLPRLMKTGRFLYALLMGVGISILVLTRPYEGLLLCLAVAFALGRWIVKGKNKPPLGTLVRRAVFPLIVIFGSVAWLGYYDYKAFGNPLTLPYTIDRQTYSPTPYYVWQKLRPEPIYPDQAMRAFYEDDSQIYRALHSWRGFLPWTAAKVIFNLLFYTGFLFLPALFMFRRAFLDRRMRFLAICTLILVGGFAIEVYLVPYYLAAFVVVLYAFGLQMMRHLRVWKSGANPVGLALVRFTIAACVLMAGVRVLAEPLHLGPPEFPEGSWNLFWYGPQHFGTERMAIGAWLERQPGRQLVIVRYWGNHHPVDEWVYNSADIDSAKVIWARDVGLLGNRELIRYYGDFKVWLVEPDAMPARITPYPMPEPK